MDHPKPTSVADRLRDGERLDRAILAARRRVLRLHRQTGVPLIVREGDRIVEVSPDAIHLPEEPPDDP